METADAHGAPNGYDTDVLVVGSGPAGSTTALALATYGVRVRVVTRYNWLANTPRAHITNQRAMEVLRDLGVEDVAHLVGTPWSDMGEMVFAKNLVDPEIARLGVWGVGIERHSDYEQGSPCPLLDIPQPLMESLLVDAAAARGASYSFNTEFVAHTDDGSGVVATLRDRLSGYEYQVRSRYLVGADGANSAIVDAVGLPMTGEMGLEGTVYARFGADLTALVAHRPGILHRILYPGFGQIGLRTLRVVRPWNDWLAGWGFDLSGPAPDLSQESVEEVIRTMIGDPDIPLRVRDVSIWKVNKMYATRYSAGLVHCAGDAVHRHPPSSGLGSNTSMQDAFNLAWKLAYAVHGWAGQDLLDTYSTERAPVGRQIVERANQSRDDYAALNELLRPDENGTLPIDRIDDATEAGVSARAALVEGVRIKNYEFNAQGVELNQHYESAAVLPDGRRTRNDADPSLHVHRSTDPGAKIPHAWLVRPGGHRVSTLDVVGRGLFSLVTGVAGVAWEGAVERLDLPYLRTVRIGTAELRDVYGTWHDVRDIEEAGALLVRPDGHIAWRHSAAVWGPDEAHGLLVDALTRLGLTHA